MKARGRGADVWEGNEKGKKSETYRNDAPNRDSVAVNVSEDMLPVIAVNVSEEILPVIPGNDTDTNQSEHNGWDSDDEFPDPFGVIFVELGARRGHVIATGIIDFDGGCFKQEIPRWCGETEKKWNKSNIKSNQIKEEF